MTKGRKEPRRIGRWDPERKPTLGGIVLYIVFLFSLSMAYGPFFDAANGNGAQLMGLLAASSLAFLMGLSDDVYETRPLLKLAVQATCGVILVLSGTSFSLPGPEWIAASATILWVVLLMNSFNMIDNMDGIAGGIALGVIAIALLSSVREEGMIGGFWPVLLGLFAGVLGFLPYNFNPSRIFLGDAGSQFLGLFLAFLGVQLFWEWGSAELPETGFRELFQSALLLLLVFWTTISDTLTVFALRLLRGVSPLKGGKDHTTHACSYSGCSDRQVNLLFFSWSLLNGALAFGATQLVEAFWVRVSTLIAYMFITFALMFATAYRSGSGATAQSG